MNPGGDVQIANQPADARERWTPAAPGVDVSGWDDVVLILADEPVS